MSLLKDWGEHENTYTEALCAPRKPSVVGAAPRKAWLRALDAPFRTDSASVASVKELCAVCPLTLQCAVEGIGSEYGVWAGELHEPELDDEVLGAGA